MAHPQPGQSELQEDAEEKDYYAEMSHFIEAFSVNDSMTDALSEINVLQSIYGEQSLRLWQKGTGSSASGFSADGGVRYEVRTSLSDYPDDADTSIRILISLPPTYPAKGPPQLQLLSRYIGAFSVESDLFGAVLRTFISQDGVEWNQDTVCVFDGIENCRERCSRWYKERLSEDKVNSMVREVQLERHSSLAPNSDKPDGIGLLVPDRDNLDGSLGQPSLPLGLEIFVAEPLIDRKSVFIGRACRISDPSQVPILLDYLMTDRRIARAAHPIINAWRCTVDGKLHQDNDDDGETAAGGRLAHLLQILDIQDVLVVVTRYFGGTLLGADRFKHINQAARSALDLGGFLDPVSEGKRTKKRN